MSPSQLLRRIRRLEAIVGQRRSDPFDLAGAFERRLNRLSPSDRSLIDEAQSRMGDSDCPEHLRAVWQRWETACAQENEENPSILNHPSDWWL
jgi:hypothetical protein